MEQVQECGKCVVLNLLMLFQSIHGCGYFTRISTVSARHRVCSPDIEVFHHSGNQRSGVYRTYLIFTYICTGLLDAISVTGLYFAAHVVYVSSQHKALQPRQSYSPRKAPPCGPPP